MKKSWSSHPQRPSHEKSIDNGRLLSWEDVKALLHGDALARELVIRRKTCGVRGMGGCAVGGVLLQTSTMGMQVSRA
jgi:hypothetical protein